MWPFRPKVDVLRQKGDVPALIRASRHRNASVRRDAVEALGQFSSREALEALCFRLGDARRSVREAALAALAAMEDPGGVLEAAETAARRLAGTESARGEERAWRCEGKPLGKEAVALAERIGGPAGARFLAAAATEPVGCIEPEAAARAFEKLPGAEPVKTLLAALESAADDHPLRETGETGEAGESGEAEGGAEAAERGDGEARRVALVGRVLGRQALAERGEGRPEEAALFERELVPRAVTVLERFLLRPTTTAAAADALGRIGTVEAVEVLGRALTGRALAAFPDEAELRSRVVEALERAREGADAELRERINGRLAAALRLVGPAGERVRSAAAAALADWAPDNAEDHAWLLMAGGFYEEAAEMGAPAVDALAAAVGGDSLLADRERALDALLALSTEEALVAMRRLLEKPGLEDVLREKLERALDRAEADTHLAALRSREPAVRRAAAQWLTERRLEPPPGTEDEAFLLAARGDWDLLVERGQVAVEALRLAAETDPLPAGTALARLGSDLACDYLGPLVRKGGAERAAALDALVELGTERAAVTLASALTAVPDRASLRTALVTIGEPAVAALQPALSSNDLVLNRFAAEVIRAIGHVPEDAGEKALLAVAAGDWASASAAGPAAVEPLKRWFSAAARRHAAYDLLTEVAVALARTAPAGELLALVDDAGRPLQERLTLAAGLARVGESRGVDRLLRWLFTAPRRLDEPPVPWLVQLLDGVAERMGLTGRAARAMALAATYAVEPLLLGDQPVGLRTDTAAGDEAVTVLLECDVPAAVNALNLVAEAEGGEVTLEEPGYQGAVTLAVDFSARRSAACRRLRQLGKPPYDPEAFFRPVSD